MASKSVPCWRRVLSRVVIDAWLASLIVICSITSTPSSSSIRVMNPSWRSTKVGFSCGMSNSTTSPRASPYRSVSRSIINSADVEAAFALPKAVNMVTASVAAVVLAVKTGTPSSTASSTTPASALARNGLTTIPSTSSRSIWRMSSICFCASNCPFDTVTSKPSLSLPYHSAALVNAPIQGSPPSPIVS